MSQVVSYSCRLVVVGLWLLMVGCATRVADVAPPVALPEAFSVSGEGNLPERWWRELNDPELDALIERAFDANLSLRAAWARLEQAEAVLRRSGAALEPSLNLDLGFRRTWQRVGTEDDGFSSVETRRRSAGLAASYEIDLWGRIRSERNAAALDMLATREDLRALAITLSAQIASLWYDLHETQGQLDLLAAQTDITSRTLQVITGRFERGRASATDVLQQRQLLESRRGEMQRVRSRRDVIEHALAVLLGDPPSGAIFETGAKLPELPPLPATGVPAYQLNRRPDVRAAYLDVQAADQRLAAAIADQYPRLSLTAGLETGAEDYRDLIDNWLATLAANLTAPLVDGGRRRAEVDRTRAVVVERVQQYGLALLTAMREVEDALAQERRQRELITSLEEQLALAKQVLDRAQSSYLQGGVEFLRVLDAQQSVQNLERDLLTARRNLLGFRIELYRALAGPIDLTPPTTAVDSETMEPLG